MPIVQEHPLHTRYQEKSMRGAYFEASASYIFPKTGQDSNRRRLELCLTQSEIDEDSDPLNVLLMPLRVSLTEEADETGEGRISGYEDVYFFTHDGDFFVHGWRKYFRDPTTHAKCYISVRYKRDGDMKKLSIYGEAIQEMLQGRRMDHTLEDHPTVQELKTHTLWKHEPDPCK